MNNTAPIICGVDGSPGSRSATMTARTLARQLHRRLVLVHVVPPRPPMPLAAVPVSGHPVGTAQMAELDQLESEAAFRPSPMLWRTGTSSTSSSTATRPTACRRSRTRATRA